MKDLDLINDSVVIAIGDSLAAYRVYTNLVITVFLVSEVSIALGTSGRYESYCYLHCYCCF